MGFFDKVNNLFSGDGSDRKELWNPVTTLEDLDTIFLASNEQPQVVFKHSGSCSVSFFAKRNVDSPSLWEGKEAGLHIIDVIRHRPISLGFAERVNIRHESPQLFVIKDGEVIWSGSHQQVNAQNVEQVFANLASN